MLLKLLFFFSINTVRNEYVPEENNAEIHAEIFSYDAEESDPIVPIITLFGSQVPAKIS